MRDRGRVRSNFGLNLVASRLAESIFNALLIQPQPAAFQVTNVLPNGFIHEAILT